MTHQRPARRIARSLSAEEAQRVLDRIAASGPTTSGQVAEALFSGETHGSAMSLSLQWVDGQMVALPRISGVKLS